MHRRMEASVTCVFENMAIFRSGLVNPVSMFEVAGTAKTRGLYRKIQRGRSNAGSIYAESPSQARLLLPSLPSRSRCCPRADYGSVPQARWASARSEEHTSELQSP